MNPDFVSDLPLTNRGNDSILILVDSLSKMVHFVPARRSYTAADIVESLAGVLIRCRGFSDTFLSDRDPRLQWDLWLKLCNRFDISRALSPSYHPLSDGQTERVNRGLKQMLQNYIQSHDRKWQPLLPYGLPTRPQAKPQLSPHPSI